MKLKNPETGDVWVNPNEPIIVECSQIDDINRLTIRMAGRPILHQGEWAEGWLPGKSETHNGNLYLSFRKKGGMPPEDILVQIIDNKTKRRSHEQRFFVRGAHTKIKAYKRNYNKRVFGGWDNSRYPIFNDGLRLGKELPDVGEYNLADAALGPDGKWVMAFCRDGKTYLLFENESAREFDFEPTQLKMTKKFIHMQASDRMSLHLPLGYIPSRSQSSVNAFFPITCDEGGWKMKFYDNIHIWHKKKDMIARHKVLQKDVYDIWWQTKDISRKCRAFKKIDVVSPTEIIVNDSYLINTRYPSVRRMHDSA